MDPDGSRDPMGSMGSAFSPLRDPVGSSGIQWDPMGSVGSIRIRFSPLVFNIHFDRDLIFLKMNLLLQFLMFLIHQQIEQVV